MPPAHTSNGLPVISPEERKVINAITVGGKLIEDVRRLVPAVFPDVDTAAVYAGIRQTMQDILSAEEGEVTVSDDEYYFFMTWTVFCGFILGFLAAWSWWG
jgi:hypothetical protein